MSVKFFVSIAAQGFEGNRAGSDGKKIKVFSGKRIKKRERKGKIKRLDNKKESSRADPGKTEKENRIGKRKKEGPAEGQQKIIYI